MDDFSWLIDLSTPKEIPYNSSRIPRCEEVKEVFRSEKYNLGVGDYCELPPPNGLYYKDGTIPALPEILSDVHGRLEKIFMTYPYDGKDFFKYQKFFKSFIKSLPKYTEVYLLGNINEVKESIQTNGDLNNRLIRIWGKMQDELEKFISNLKRKSDRFIAVEPQELHGYSIWAQDPFIAVWDRGQEEETIHFVEPIRFKESKSKNGENRINADSKIADHIAISGCFDGLCTSHSRVCLFFHGGNILSGDDFILVGKDDIIKTKEFFKTCLQEQGLRPEIHAPIFEAKKHGVHKAFQKAFGLEKEVISIGKKYKLKGKTPKAFRDKLYGHGDYQPFYHIDLFVTPAGYLFHEELYTIILAEPFNASSYLTPEADEYLIQPLQECMDEIKIDLEKLKVNGKRKFVVRRMPMPLIPVTTRNSTKWLPISYNNCLLEVLNNGSKKVWVPQYGDQLEEIREDDLKDDIKLKQIKQLKAYDTLALNQWKSYEYTAHPIGGCFPFIQQGGSLRCITKCLHRSDI